MCPVRNGHLWVSLSLGKGEAAEELGSSFETPLGGHAKKKTLTIFQDRGGREEEEERV
jgi:hypothetical protein